jgi:hypothetical protein
MNDEADDIKRTVYESQSELRETLDEIMERCNITDK